MSTMNDMDGALNPGSKTAAAAFFLEAATSFTADLSFDTLHEHARDLAGSLHDKLSDFQSLSMLPSFVDRSPSGQERGRSIAVDIGGSTMRVAVVRLAPGHLEVEQYRQWTITQDVKNRDGAAFFDWIAGNIQTFVGGLAETPVDMDGTTPLGLVWSFPLKLVNCRYIRIKRSQTDPDPSQTHLHDGELKDMGKGFRVGIDLKGRSINDCLAAAFQRAGLGLRLEAILNDSVSVLLAMQFLDPTATQLSIVAGTGFNGAVQLPTSALAAGKFGQRSPAWVERAQQVLVDTELCVTGQGIFPLTEWDQVILDTMPPDIAGLLGLELLVGGLFLGEVFRRVVVDAVHEAEFLGGQAPTGLVEPYSLPLETVTVLLEGDIEDTDKDKEQLSTTLGLPDLISDEDMQLLRDLAKAVMTRTAAFLAAAVCAVKNLHDTTFEEDGAIGKSTQSSCTVSCLGSVIEKCPGFMAQAQAFIDGLHARSSTAARLTLVVAPESSLTGVAVAALMARSRHTTEGEGMAVVAKQDKVASSIVDSSKDSARPAEEAAADGKGGARPIVGNSTAMP